MIKKISKKLGSSRFKRFFIFFFISSLVWLLNALSETYESHLKIQMNFTNVPVNLLLSEGNSSELSLSVKSTGFHLLGELFTQKIYQVDLSAIEELEDHYVLPKEVLQDIIVSQLPTDYEFVRLDNSVGLSLKLFKRATKKVAVLDRVRLSMMQNHRAEKLSITPDSIEISGPLDKLSKVDFLSTEIKNLNQVSHDLSLELMIDRSTLDKDLVLSPNKVLYELVVGKFSEREFSLPIKVENAGDSLLIKTFPSTIKMVCIADVRDLKDISEIDFNAYVDAQEAFRDKNHLLEVHLEVLNSKVIEASLVESEVEFILKQK